MIRVQSACKSIHTQTILDDITFHVKKGEIFGIIGPNGSGKSSLLKLLSAADKADAGEIWLGRQLIQDIPRKSLSRWVAVLQQEALPAVDFSVREIVEMGRYPFQNWLGSEKTDSSILIDSILAELNLTGLQQRSLQQLSGGERQRVALAKVMVQQPALLFLDEPTTYLDIGYQVHMMNQIADWQAKSELTVVAVLHDLNLAAQYCNRLLLLHNGKVVRIGTPDEILKDELLTQVYGITPLIVRHPVYNCPQVLL